MSIKLKLADLVQFHEGGNVSLKEEIRNLVNAKGLPGKVQYHLSRIAKAFASEVSAFAEARVNLFKELGRETESGGMEIVPEKLPEFQKRVSEMLDSELSFTLAPLKISDLGDKFEGTTAADLAACHAFITPEE